MLNQLGATGKARIKYFHEYRANILTQGKIQFHQKCVVKWITIPMENIEKSLESICRQPITL